MHKTSDLQGILFMVAATATFVVGDCFMKVVTEQLPPYEALFLRGIAASLISVAMVSVQGEWRAFPDAFNRRAILRAFAEIVSTLCYVVALSRMPIADVIAIAQIAPLILMLGAVVLLREEIGAVRVVLALVGFAGALLVAQPGTSEFSTASLLAFGTALFIATRDLIGRGVPARIPVTIVIFATMVLLMLASGVMTLLAEDWVPPTLHNVAFSGFSGAFIAVGQIGLILAYRLGRTASVAPFFYSFALWGVVAGLVVWGELPNALALCGIALIVLSGVAIVVFDQRQRRRAIALTEAV